ncbi:MAG: protein serine/threonine phosphatase, partial [Bacteroidetes bacterium]|nr:protein serine/threonine phosphatase [Bacteroidota bacterium]
ADCTGHGVPGSLMSIVSVDKLNQAVLSKKLTRPGKILSSINNDIKKALKQETAANTQKDGLDIALLYIDFVNSQLLYSGAHRPLWLIRNGNLMEYKATKTSIAGHTPFDFTFEEHLITLEKNDLILLFSDGYADQFGGPSGKKMMTRSFKEKVIKIAEHSVPQIEEVLLKHFTGWKGQYEQVDDVLVIGFKI